MPADRPVLLPLSPPPSGTRARFVEGVNGLRMHILEAGHEPPGRPAILLLHGFPELAWSWRKLIAPLAEAGFHVIAPDQRGYGRTTGWDGEYDGDISQFRLLNLVRDTIGLLSALGHRNAACVVGHNFGASVAAWCALLRPDLFGSVALMSAPFTGPPPLPSADPPAPPDIHAALAALPRPRKHYRWYFSTSEADADMRLCRQGLPAFLRAYYHFKSGDWPGNAPVPLASWTAAELARMPAYYVMDRDRTMAETVAAEMPSPDQVAACRWLTEPELAVYATEFARTGFQGGLNWYRCGTSGLQDAELQIFSGRTIDVPALFVAGARDWGIRQVPGALEHMQHRACTNMRACELVEHAGHWVQQERPGAVLAALLAFLREAAPRAGHPTSLI